MEQEFNQDTALEQEGVAGDIEIPPLEEDGQAGKDEERARESGWVPKEEFRGDLRKWRDAKAWNDHADRYLPIARATNKRLEDELAALKMELKTSKDTLGRITKMQDKFSGDFYTTKIAEIDGAIEQAVSEGDVDRYKKLKTQRDQIIKPEPLKEEEPKPDVARIHPEVARWQADNPWFRVDPKSASGDEVMTAYALYAGRQLAEKNDPVSMSGKEKEFCTKVTEMVKARFPDKFSNSNRQRTEIDEPGLRGGSEVSGVGGNHRTWNNLPVEAKQHCTNVFLKQFPNRTREDYVKIYPWD